ncbi:hypothetical protein SK128_009419 [Halocaridina rubra]|uniref:Single domain-containing protein n=1 Tax=Halocaridina rubra TaxID=373956 RepID=A0AAN8WQ86_HALRR
MVFFYTQCKLSFLILSLFLGSVSGAASFGPATVNPEYPGMCWVEHLGRAYPVRGPWALSGECGRVDCYYSQGRLMIGILTCGVIHVYPGCQEVENEHLPYPGCCPYPQCDDN